MNNNFENINSNLEEESNELKNFSNNLDIEQLVLSIKYEIKNSIEETYYNDFILKRLMKSKEDYYKEGMSICVKIFEQICIELSNNIDISVANLRNTNDEKDKVITELSEIINKYKKQRKEEKSSVKTEANDDMELLQECMDVFEEENIGNLPSVIR